MHQEFRPVRQFRVDLLECFAIVGGKFDAFPHLGGEVGALDDFHVEIEDTGVGGRADCGIARVREGA